MNNRFLKQLAEYWHKAIITEKRVANMAEG